MKIEDIWPTLDFGKESSIPATARFLPLPDRDAMDEDNRAAFDYVIARDKRKFDAMPVLRNSGLEYQASVLFRALVQSPKIAKIWANMGDLYMSTQERGSFGDRERVLGDMAIIPLLKVGPGGYINIAVAMGIPPSDIKAILDGELEKIAPEDRQIVEYAQAAVKSDLTRELFDELVKRMGVGPAIEFTTYVCYKCALYPITSAMRQIQGMPTLENLAGTVLKGLMDGTLDARENQLEKGWVK